MNTSIINPIEEALQNFPSNRVIVKLDNGRVISGYITPTEGGYYTIKLGVQQIEINPARVVKVLHHPESVRDTTL